VLRTWGFALVPIVALAELGAHVWQVHSVVTDAEWQAARSAVQADWKSGDLVVFAPDWTDPLGREYFGSELAPMANEARPDDSRYARAHEVSIRGMQATELSGWAERARTRVGPFTITTLENPQPVHVIDDLVSHGTPDRMGVDELSGAHEAPCRWGHGPSTAGGLGAGPAVPGDRFSCSGGAFVGESIIFDLSNHPRRCLYAPPGARGSVTRVTFRGVHFGTRLHGHAGLQYESELHTGADIVLSWKAGPQSLGRVVHRDGDGWKDFELDTTDLQGQTADLVAEISSASNGRQYCFEADTR
jgi:hypothetical protein